MPTASHQALDPAGCLKKRQCLLIIRILMLLTGPGMGRFAQFPGTSSDCVSRRVATQTYTTCITIPYMDSFQGRGSLYIPTVLGKSNTEDKKCCEYRGQVNLSPRSLRFQKHLPLYSPIPIYVLL